MIKALEPEGSSYGNFLDSPNPDIRSFVLERGRMNKKKLIRSSLCCIKRDSFSSQLSAELQRAKDKKLILKEFDTTLTSLPNNTIN